jgi:hypothetical protein
VRESVKVSDVSRPIRFCLPADALCMFLFDGHQKTEPEKVFIFFATMRLLPFVYSALLSVSPRKPTTWFIDGNNLLAQKGTTKDRDVLAERLLPIKASGGESIVLVFDGRPGDVLQERHEGNFHLVELAEGISSDDYILEQIHEIVSKSKTDRIQLVTADRPLRKLALEKRPGVKGVVNPLTFWKKYIPRMAGLKKFEDDVVGEEAR